MLLPIFANYVAGTFVIQQTLEVLHADTSKQTNIYCHILIPERFAETNSFTASFTQTNYMLHQKNCTKKRLNLLYVELEKEPIIKEYKSHSQWMGSAKSCFIMTHGSKTHSSDSGQILASAIMCSCESVAMTFLMEYLDGMNIEFETFLEKKMGLPILIEFATLGVPDSKYS